MKFETRDMGFGTKMVDIKPEDVKRVKDHPSCYKLSIIEKKDGSTVTLSNARRLWYWEGSASLSELAQYGTAGYQPNDGASPIAATPHRRPR